MHQPQQNKNLKKGYLIKRFVKKLDQLIGQQQKQLFCKVEKEMIEDHIANFCVVDNEGNNFSLFCSIQKFKQFAPNVYLMFKLLRHLIIMFSVLSVLAIVQVIILLCSPFFSDNKGHVRTNLLRLTIASLPQQDYQAYVCIDALMILIVCGFYIWWNEKLRGFAASCNQQNQLPSYLTVQMKNVNKKLNHNSLKEYLQKQKDIIPHEIYTARNYGQFLKHYKKLTQCSTSLRELKELYTHQDDQNAKQEMARSILERFLELSQLYCSIKLEKFNERKYNPKEVFIVLQNYDDRAKLLTNSGKITLKEQTYQFQACQVEPQAIAWQNIGISFINYWIRALVVFFILFLVTCIGILLIFMLQILQTASIGDAYYYKETVQGTLGANPDSQKSQKIEVNVGKLVILILLTPIIVFMCKKVIMGLLTHFVSFRRYSTEVKRVKSQIITLTLFYFMVIGVLHLVMYLKTEGSQALSIYEILYPFILQMFKIANYLPASIHLYSDYSISWYKQSTFFIIVICATSFNIANIFKFLLNLISFTIQKFKTRQQKTIYQIRKCLHGVDIHTQHFYASMIVINLFALLYGAPMPITICFSLLSLIVLFLLTKITLIRYAFKPMRLGHSINRTATIILFIGVIVHCLMTPIFFGAPGIGVNSAHQSSDVLSASAFQEKSSTIAQRYQKLGPFYLTVAVVITLYITLRKPFIKNILPIIKEKLNKNNISQKGDKKQYFGLYPSYSMHYNPLYGQILKNIFLLNSVEAQRISCPIPQTFKQIAETSKDLSASLNFIFDLNRSGLNKQKYAKLFEDVEKLFETLEQKSNSELDIPSISSQRETNNDLFPDEKLMDQIKEDV